MKKYRAWVPFALACALMAPSVSWAAAIEISNTQALAFGKFVAGSAGAVTVSAGGVRSAGGGVVLVPSGGGSVAQFSVSGDPNVIYDITLPADGIVSLTSGANSMALNTFTSSPNLTGTLSAGGTQSLSVGATLSVGGNQASGSYSGSFDVTVDYN
ncbi:MAG: DUF4402 domain-containing protein [Desulfobulbaceae bacterium]|nr:DUF4402 domain-containing protein [Desulfobulbaceae bacterium]